MNYQGMLRTSGHNVDGLDHIRQSIADILMTPVGSRVMRRSYGSLVPALVDQPGDAATGMRIMSAIVMALTKWEPRIRITRCTISPGDEPHQIIVELDASRTDGPYAGRPEKLAIPLGGDA